MSLTTACLFGVPDPPAPTADQCTWVKTIVTDPADVLTRSTKKQIVALDRKVKCFCKRQLEYCPERPGAN